MIDKIKKSLTNRRHLIYGALSILFLAVTILVLLFPSGVNSNKIDLKPGDVATSDIIANKTITYESYFLTNQAQENAVRNVESVYIAPDTSVARTQLENLHLGLDFISLVRNDDLATSQQKINDLTALQSIYLNESETKAILNLQLTTWDIVKQESIIVLEQVMRSTIREDRLDDFRRSVPTFVSLSLPSYQADIVVNLVTAFVMPNSFFSQELTDLAREEAKNAVAPVLQTFLNNQTIIQKGQIVVEQDIEALEALGLLNPMFSERKAVSVGLVSFLTLIYILLFLRKSTKTRESLDHLVVIIVLFLIFFYIGRIVANSNEILQYVFPVAGFGMTLAVLFSPRAGIWLSVPLALLIGFGQPNGYEMTIYYLMSSIFGAMTLSRNLRLRSFFLSGFIAAIAAIFVSVSFHITDPNETVITLLSLGAYGLLYGILSTSFTFVLQYFISLILQIVTPMQLLELARPDQRLLQIILRNAPGTYQHSLQVANLAEVAAERINADPLLTRVGALYHDVGKSKYPLYFIENQQPNTPNPHNQLSPFDSAKIIIRHIEDGVELAEKHRIPPQIINFITEHHGTTVTRYQYSQALEEANNDTALVNIADYTYPGPKPRSKETTLVMLADAIEARTRATKPSSENDIETLVKNEVLNRIMSGQLDESPLSMKEIIITIDSFTKILVGIYHPRIQYPDNIHIETVPPQALPEEAEPVE